MNRSRARAGSRRETCAADEGDRAAGVLRPAGLYRALVASAVEFFKKDYDHLLFSFHAFRSGTSKVRHHGCHCLAAPNCCETPSPAHAQCYRASATRRRRCSLRKRRAVGQVVGVVPVALGKDPWLKPYTDYELPRLAIEGKKRMLVICPAFVSDCLETIENRHPWLRRIHGREREGIHPDTVHE